MVTRPTETLPSLYEADETAWLEAMAELIRERRYEELDYQNLCEYLTDMARRDRREVENRLVTLIAHVLEWKHQPRKRTRSWRATITEQRQQLVREVARGVLRSHAEAVLSDVYGDAVELAAEETGISAKKFPAECPYALDELLSANVLDG